MHADKTHGGEESVSSDGDGQLFVRGVHGFDDAAELLHEELQLVLVFVDVPGQQRRHLVATRGRRCITHLGWKSMAIGVTSLPKFSNLLEKGLQRVVARLLHLAVDVAAELGHDVEQHPVVVHEAAAELGSVSGQQVESGCFERQAG